MNARERLQLWNWINEYTVACGGDPSDKRYARDRRDLAVTRVEETVDEITSSNLRAYRKTIRETVGALDEQGREKAAIFLEERIREMEGKLGLEPDYDVKVQADPADPTKVNVTCQVPASWCERGLIDLPENPTIQQNPESHERLRKALVDWTTRGNMRHENKAEKWPTPMPDGAALIYFTHEEVEEERAEAEKRTAEMTPATVEEQVEFVKKAIELGCMKLIGEPEYVGKMPERQDIPCDSKPEVKDGGAFDRPADALVVQALRERDEARAELERLRERIADHNHQILCGYPRPHAVATSPEVANLGPAPTNADLVCVHARGSECECVCHADPPKGVIIHDRYCCETCFKCGFRTVLP